MGHIELSKYTIKRKTGILWISRVHMDVGP